VGFQTKVDIALGLLDQAAAWGVRHAGVVADADYGDNPVFLNGLEARGERYVVAVCSDFRVATTRRTTDDGQHIAAVLDALPRAQWQTVRWREGSRGWLRAKCIAGRGWRIDGDGTRHIGWLIGQRPTRGAGEGKYYWSNCPAAMGLGRMIEYTHRRYWIEQFHEEAKGLLGWDQYQGRLWPGFHRNAVLVMLSYSFLVWWEWHQRAQRNRPGRPRRAFSPSAVSTALLARQHPPPGCGAAARASHP
jgi:SRSO17 transposase